MSRSTLFSYANTNTFVYMYQPHGRLTIVGCHVICPVSLLIGISGKHY